MSGILAAVLVALVVIVVLALRFFRRATQDISLVRSGFGGTRAVIGGGIVVVPLLHNVTRVNMNTMRLELVRTHDKALITGDRMRADVTAEFYVHVRPDRKAVELAAQTLGSRTLDPEGLKSLVEGKFVDALRSVAAEHSMEELHTNRRAFAQAVSDQLEDSLAKNGLELDTVSITALDQTDIQYFNPSNAFDAEGLTRLTEQIEQRKKKRNDIEQDTSIAVQRKTLETEKTRLDLEKESEYARLQQQYDIADRRAQQQAEIAEAEARSRAASEQSRIDADHALEARRVQNDTAIEVARLQGRAEQARQEQEQNRTLAELETSRGELEATRERTVTARETETAERDKAIELIKAAREAEREAEYHRILARARRDRVEIEGEERQLRASAEAEGQRLEAEGALAHKKVEAEAMRLLNEARNALSEGQTQAEVRRRLIEALPEIVRASGEPLKHVDSIRIARVDGITRDGGGRLLPDAGSERVDGHIRGDAASELLSALMDYRAQAPVIDAILREVGLAGDGSGLSPDALAPRGRGSGEEA